jgi:hypothetical protein
MQTSSKDGQCLRKDRKETSGRVSMNVKNAYALLAYCMPFAAATDQKHSLFFVKLRHE